MDINRILYQSHSGVRYLVILIAIVAFLYFVYAFLTKRNDKKTDRLMMMLFSTALDIQFLLGLLVLWLFGFSPSYRLAHAGLMLLAVLAGHSYMGWRNSDDGGLRARNNLILIVVVFALVFIGITQLPGRTLFGTV